MHVARLKHLKQKVHVEAEARPVPVVRSANALRSTRKQLGESEFGAFGRRAPRSTKTACASQACQLPSLYFRNGSCRCVVAWEAVEIDDPTRLPHPAKVSGLGLGEYIPLVRGVVFIIVIAICFLPACPIYTDS
jgi:hypothetical protein